MAGLAYGMVPRRFFTRYFFVNVLCEVVKTCHKWYIITDVN